MGDFLNLNTTKTPKQNPTHEIPCVLLNAVRLQYLGVVLSYSVTKILSKYQYYVKYSIFLQKMKI